ncbi:phosphosulfolactate synthase [Rhodohalobacter sp.]|uniref:phosphosulfolactate synthase n=1 Tax=Rhodohalobacter sp. TaxID=1974210 RepID=UPI002AD93535|nr:phosphosulfolactate synthase [Rhodohalobacter sp.]
MPVANRPNVFWKPELIRFAIESEGITENADPLENRMSQADFIDEIGLEKLMFEAADPEVFAWYMKNYGPEVNLFVWVAAGICPARNAAPRYLGYERACWGRVLTYEGGLVRPPGFEKPLGG